MYDLFLNLERNKTLTASKFKGWSSQKVLVFHCTMGKKLEGNAKHLI